MWGEKDSNLRSFRNGFTVRPIWPLWYLPDSIKIKKRADGGIRTPDQLITNQLLWPTELHRQYLVILYFKRTLTLMVDCFISHPSEKGLQIYKTFMFLQKKSCFFSKKNAAPWF